MRNPDRIYKFCNELAEIWETNAPQWRFGQLICNVFGALYVNVDPFFLEEDRMIKIFKDFFSGEN